MFQTTNQMRTEPCCPIIAHSPHPQAPNYPTYEERSTGGFLLLFMTPHDRWSRPLFATSPSGWWFLHVVTILKNMGVRQWEGWHPFFIMENNKNVWNHQPAIGTDIPNCFLDIPNAGAVHPTASQRRPVSPTASFWSSKERNNKRIYIARKCNHLRNLHHP